MTPSVKVLTRSKLTCDLESDFFWAPSQNRIQNQQRRMERLGHQADISGDFEVLLSVLYTTYAANSNLGRRPGKWGV